MRKETIIGITGNETIIGSGVRVKGNLASEHDIIIDGSLSGNVKTKGAITVGVNGIIKGNLAARDVSIAGQLDGDIKSSNQVSIGETGRVRGNIHCGELSVATGAVFMGTSIMAMPEMAADNPPVDEPTATDAPEA